MNVHIQYTYNCARMLTIAKSEESEFTKDTSYLPGFLPRFSLTKCATFFSLIVLSLSAYSRHSLPEYTFYVFSTSPRASRTHQQVNTCALKAAVLA